MRKVSLVIVCFALAFAAAGCSKLAALVTALAAEGSGGDSAPASATPSVREDAGRDVAEDAVQTEEDSTYTNSYLGFSFTVPKGWWLYSINEANFAQDPSRTESPDILDISYGEDAGRDYSYIGMVSFANLRDSRRDNHIGFDINAETVDGINSLDAYMEYFEAFMLEPDENTYQLLDSGRVEISGLQYEKRVLEVVREEDNYIYATFTRPVRNNYYLTILANYWPKNRNAETLITETLSKAAR